MRRQRNYGKTVNKPSQPKKKNYSPIKIILVILMVTNLVSFMVWQNIKGLELDKKLQHLEKKHYELQNRYQNKLFDYETLKNSKEIKKIAREKLGMITSQKKNFIRLGIENKSKLIEKFTSKKNQHDSLNKFLKTNTKLEK